MTGNSSQAYIQTSLMELVKELTSMFRLNLEIKDTQQLTQTVWIEIFIQTQSNLKKKKYPEDFTVLHLKNSNAVILTYYLRSMGRNHWKRFHTPTFRTAFLFLYVSNLV